MRCNPERRPGLNVDRVLGDDQLYQSNTALIAAVRVISGSLTWSRSTAGIAGNEISGNETVKADALIRVLFRQAGLYCPD